MTSRPDPGPATYSDGMKSERDMLSALQKTQDVSLDSDEVMQHIKDVPSYYHFGTGRSTILQSLDLPSNSTVLELGAGCGAITRYLGETFSRIDAIEASPIRSEIARERCRDLDNVTVLCKDLKTHSFACEYDFVVVIGVLEYSPIHIFPGEDPRAASLRFLELARRALAPSGHLVLAIENRLGLDFWAGAPEPHTGRPYDGIYQYPIAGSQITFSKVELQQLLADAGFTDTAFYYCFPNYHFARTILSSRGDEREHFLHNWVEFPSDSTPNPKTPSFNKLLAAQALGGARMLRDFANAFLVVAGTNGVPGPNWAAKVYNMKRRPAHRTVTTLGLHPQPFVRKAHLPCDGSTVDGQPKPVSKDVRWRSGNLLTFEVARAALGRDFPNYIDEIMARYDRELRDQFGTGEVDSGGFPLLRPESLDALFSNIIEGESGRWHFIDEEVLSEGLIPMDFVLYRCIRFCLYRHGVSDAQSRKIIRSLYPAYGRGRHKSNRTREDAFQRAMVSDPVDPRYLRRSLLMRLALHDSFRPYVERVWFRIPPDIRSFIRSHL